MADADIRLNFSATGADETASKIDALADAAGGVAAGASGAAKGVEGILADIAKVSAALSRSGGAEAKKVDESLKSLAETLASGRLGADAVEDIGNAVRSLLVQTDRLPPKGIAEFAQALASIAARSGKVAQELAKAANVEFSVGGDGLAALDSIKRKIDVISDAGRIGEGIAALEEDMGSLDQGEARRLEVRIREIKGLLSGRLDSGAVKRLQDEAKLLAEEMDTLKASSLESVGASGKEVIEGLGDLGASLDVAQRNMEGLQSVADAVFERMGMSVGRLDGNVARLASRIPGIGKALAAVRSALSGPLGWILAAVAAVGKGVVSIIGLAEKARAQVAGIRIGNLEHTLGTLSSETERYVRLLDLAAERRRAEKQITDEQAEAQHRLNDLMEERAKIAATHAGMTEEERFDVEERYSRHKDAEKTALDRERLSRDREDNEADIEDIDAKIAELEGLAKEYGEIRSNAAGKQDRLQREAAGMWIRDSVWDIGDRRENTVREAERLGEVASDAAERFKATMEQLEDLRNRRAEAVGKRSSFADRQKDIDEQEKLNEEMRKRRREEEELRRALAVERRERDLMLRERRERDRDDEYARSRDRWTKSEAERMSDASERLARFGEEADRARETMEELERKYGGRSGMSEADSQRYEAAKEDWERARDMQRQAQTEVDDAAKGRAETAWSDADRQRQWMQEDEDFERQGRYDIAGWDGKVAMDRARMEEGRALRIDAEERLKSRENLTDRQIALFEAQRDLGRARETDARQSLRGLLREGDRDTAAFEAKMRGADGNRLTQMGLGGNGVADYTRQTAKNTSLLVQQNREMLARFSGGMQARSGGRLGEVTWAMR